MAEDYKPGQLPFPEQDDRRLFCKFHYKGVLLVLIPLVFAPILFIPHVLASRMIYITIVIYLYYICNVMAQGAVAFLYIVFLPLFGITSSKDLCKGHYADVIFVTFGAIYMGLMMDASKLSERLAMIVIRICGTNIRVLQLFLMLCAAFTSILWNATIMSAFWMKVAQAVLQEYNKAGILNIYSDEEPYEIGAKPYPSLPAVGIYLTVCYSSSLGAMLSPIQDPNEFLHITYIKYNLFPGGSFAVIGLLPFFLGLMTIALWMNIIFFGIIGGVKSQVTDLTESRDTMKVAIIERKLTMGPWTTYSILALIVILVTLIVLITRRPILFSGWADLIKKANCGESVAIIFMSIFFFGIAANYFFCRYYMCRQPEKEGTAPSLIGWKIVNTNTPWAHIFMLCAGFGFAMGLKDSKLFSETVKMFVDMKLNAKGSLPLALFFGSVLTSFAPATAVAKHTFKIVTSVGSRLKVGSGTFIVPYGLALHNQFLLPVSSGANTIVSGWGNIRPYLFLIGGIIPTTVIYLSFLLSIMLFGQGVLPGYLDKSGAYTLATAAPK